VPDLIARGGGDLAEARGLVVLAVLLLRLAWTAGEVLLAVTLFPLRPRRGVVACPN
jgi:cytochrome b